jgi:hypothetical protein
MTWPDQRSLLWSCLSLCCPPCDLRKIEKSRGICRLPAGCSVIVQHRMLSLPVIWVHGRQPSVLWGWGFTFRSSRRRRVLAASVAAIIAVWNMWSHHIQHAIEAEALISRSWSTGTVSLLQLRRSAGRTPGRLSAEACAAVYNRTTAEHVSNIQSVSVRQNCKW